MMQIKSMGIFELMALRNWLEMVYTSGRGYISFSKEELERIKIKLADVDKEMLNRVLDNKYVGSFFDEKFDETLKKIQTGEIDEKE